MNTQEYHIVQNPALGAVALWHFAAEYIEKHSNGQPPSLPLAMCVLPIVFHKESVDLLSHRHREGGLLSARAADRTLGLGLNDRIKDMYEASFEALAVGAGAGLLVLHNGTPSLGLGSVSAKTFRGGPAVRGILRTSRRLGYWFAAKPLSETCSLLRISL